MELLSVTYRDPISASIAGTLASPNLPKSTCRHGLSLSMEPQNDFFLKPTSVNVDLGGKLGPDICTEAALCAVHRRSPVHSKLHRPPAGSSFRTASHSACGIVILTVITLSSAKKESSACCCRSVIVTSPVRRGL